MSTEAFSLAWVAKIRADACAIITVWQAEANRGAVNWDCETAKATVRLCDEFSRLLDEDWRRRGQAYERCRAQAIQFATDEDLRGI